MSKKHTPEQIIRKLREAEAERLRFPKFGGHEVNGVDSDQGVHRCLGSARRTRPSTSSRP